MASGEHPVKRVFNVLGFGAAALLFLIVLAVLLFIGLRVGVGLGWVKTLGPYDYPGSTWVSESPQITLQVSPEYDSRYGPYEAAKAYVTLDGEEIPALILIEQGKTVIIARKPAKSVDDNLLYGSLRKMTSKEVVIEVTEDNAFSGQYETITLKRVG